MKRVPTRISQDLARFVRKRDPRYKSHLASQKAENAVKAAGRPSSQSTPQKSSTPVPSTSTYVEQAWQKTFAPDMDADLEWAAAENGEDAEEWECVACGKTFRSEAAWDSHERSKKHIQAVEMLKQAMLDEDEELRLDVELVNDTEDTEAVDEPPDSPLEILTTADVAPEGEGEEGGAAQAEHNTHIPRKKKKGKKSRLPSPEPLSKIARRTKGARPGVITEPQDADRGLPTEPVLVPAGDSPICQDDTETPTGQEQEPTASQPEISKRDKRRAREAAKRAKEQESANVTQASIHSYMT